MSRGFRAARSFLTFCPAALSLFAAACAGPSGGGWQKAGGPLYNVSGMAFAGAAGRGKAMFLVVHDNKKPDEPRVGAMTIGDGPAAYRRLRWPDRVALPVDLEAISTIPDAPGRFLALESSGRLFHLRYDGGAIELLHTGRLPDAPKGSNFEGLSVQKLDGRLIVAWGHRGDGKEPGRLYWGAYDLPTDTVTALGDTDVVVAYPRGHGTRHIADLRVDEAGVVWVCAASDPGDEGPFHSAVYTAGVLESQPGGDLGFRPHPAPTRLWTFRHKVEAMELVPGRRGGVYFGSDDEKKGGWVFPPTDR